MDGLFAALMDGSILTAMGMGIVFAFLLLMVIVISISGSVIRRFFPEREPADERFGANGETEEIAVAIAAVKAYSQK